MRVKTALVYVTTMSLERIFQLTALFTCSRACQIRGSPEQWLARFELAMVGVVRHCVASGVSSYEAGEGWSQWCLLQPAQVAITVVRLQSVGEGHQQKY